MGRDKRRRAGIGACSRLQKQNYIVHETGDDALGEAKIASLYAFRCPQFGHHLRMRLRITQGGCYNVRATVGNACNHDVLSGGVDDDHD